MELFKQNKTYCPICSPKREERLKTEHVFDYLFVTPSNKCPFCQDFKTPGEICGRCIEVVQERCRQTFSYFASNSVPQCSVCRSEKDHPVCMICLTEFKKADTKDPVILTLREKNSQLNKMWNKRTVMVEPFERMECDS